MNCLKLAKYLKKYRSYGVYAGLDMAGRLAAVPIHHIHIDENHHAVMLVVPMPMPRRQDSPLIKPRIELSR